MLFQTIVLGRICLLILKREENVCLPFLPPAFFWGKGRQRTWAYHSLCIQAHLSGLGRAGPWPFLSKKSTSARRTELCPGVPPCQGLPRLCLQSWSRTSSPSQRAPMWTPSWEGTFLPFRSKEVKSSMELRLNPCSYLRYHDHRLHFQVLTSAQASHGESKLPLHHLLRLLLAVRYQSGQSRKAQLHH